MVKSTEGDRGKKERSREDKERLCRDGRNRPAARRSGDGLWKRVLAAVFAFLCLLSAGRTPVRAEEPEYFIRVNRQENCVTIYTKDEEGAFTVPVKAMACSTGGENTPLGTFRTPVKYRWRALVGNTWGQYATRINGPILFHSVPYDRPDPSAMQKGEFNYLGSTRSHGCIRLNVRDTKWIYDNCPIGTAVEIYDDDDPGPLGKPETFRIGEEDTWDPTDVWAEGNPFLTAAPEIRVNGGILSFHLEDDYDLTEGVTAVSSTGEDITEAVEVIGEVPADQAGIYRIIYRVTDLLGRQTERCRFVRVIG